MRLIFSPAFKAVPQNQAVLDACERIRRRLGEMVDTHLEGGDFNDIASQLIAARSEDATPFTRTELIDQLGVFFLAGHETTASVLTWVLFILGTHPDMAERVRAEVREVAGDGPITIACVAVLTKPTEFRSSWYRTGAAVSAT